MRATATVTAAAGAMIAATLAVLLNLGLSLLDTAEPALRLPAMAFATFLAMYSARTFSLGPISYLSGFVIVLLQSVVDDIPSPEALTHLSLWLWVVIFVPVVATVVLNLLFGQRSAVLVQRTAGRVLAAMESGMRDGHFQPHIAEWREITASLLARASGASSRLLEAITILEVFPADAPAPLRMQLADMIRACRQAIEPDGRGEDSGSVLERARALESEADRYPAIVACAHALARPCAPRLTNRAVRGRQARRPSQNRSSQRDAFTNPEHWQFALKTTLAVMVVYCIYTLLDWPGLRTSIVTCFFVALGSLGETIHKLTLRLSGAIIGGSLAGICIVWVLPHLTDIGQLSILIAVVAAGAGWIATSSERLAYAGLQIAFAFFVGVLQTYAPANDLTVLRDRVVGILLGNIVMTVVFSQLWPESATTRMRAALADALRAIGKVMNDRIHVEDARIGAVQAIIRAEHFLALSTFELRLLPTRPDSNTPKLSALRRLAGAAFVATSEPLLTTPASGQLARNAQREVERLQLEIEDAAPSPH